MQTRPAPACLQAPDDHPGGGGAAGMEQAHGAGGARHLFQTAAVEGCSAATALLLLAVTPLPSLCNSACKSQHGWEASRGDGRQWRQAMAAAGAAAAGLCAGWVYFRGHPRSDAPLTGYLGRGALCQLAKILPRRFATNPASFAPKPHNQVKLITAVARPPQVCSQRCAQFCPPCLPAFP